MLLALNGATTMKATLPEDIAATSAAGFKALEIWAAKMDDYLKANSVEDLKGLFDRADLQPASINSIEFITFRSIETLRSSVSPSETTWHKKEVDELFDKAKTGTDRGVVFEDHEDHIVRITGGVPVTAEDRHRFVDIQVTFVIFKSFL